MPPPWARRGQSPSWWPEGTEWPPRGDHPRLLKRRFLLVVGGAFAGLILLFFLAGIIARNLFDHTWGQGRDEGWDGPPMFGFVLIGLGIFFVIRFIRRTALPIGDVMVAAERVATGDYGARVEPRGPREVRRLAATFNEMTARLGANDEQRRRLLADVTHELRTPLAIIRGNVEGMLDGLYPSDEEHLVPIVEETKQMARLLDDLHTLATVEAGALRLHREPTDLALLVNDILAALAPRAAQRDVELTSMVEEMPEIVLDPVRIRQVLENVLMNALRYTPAGGWVRLDVRKSDGMVGIAVVDTGPGVAADALPHIFDRFAKSADSGGSGLGLAIARSLVEAHGGQIRAASESGRGLTVSISLPAETA